MFNSITRDNQASILAGYPRKVQRGAAAPAASMLVVVDGEFVLLTGGVQPIIRRCTIWDDHGAIVKLGNTTCHLSGATWAREGNTVTVRGKLKYTEHDAEITIRW